ncbi:hypothetical protein VTH06DRAFT_5642 [Thermothelomyces fergusii]
MMLARQCSARSSLALLAALLLSIVLLTARRLHGGYPVGWPQLPDRLKSQHAGADEEGPQQGPETEAWSTPAGGSQGQGGIGSASPNFCGRDWEFLRSEALGLTKNIVYTRRCVKPVHGDVDRNAVGNVEEPLIASTTSLDLGADCSRVAPPPCEPLALEVPPAFPEPRGQYGHLLFAVASTYERVRESLPVFAHWLADTGAQLLAVIADADDPVLKPDLGALEAQYRDRRINATVVSPRFKESLPRKNTKDEKAKRPAAVEQLHFLMIRDMLELSTPQTRWLGVLDDDTFFPALHPLSVALGEHDHTRPAWLGALADNWISMKIWGFMAYGGAGIFLSVPLARELDPHLEACVRETTVPSGDGMLRDCVYGRTTTKLTVVDGLHQNDIRGDAAGFFESGRRVLSIHHWKSWYRAPVAPMAAVARVCGDCFLQRWRFGADTLLANGYSVSVYRDGVGALDLRRMERTFDEADGRFDFSYGPFRPRLPGDRKKSYRLEAVDGGSARGEKLRQLYVHRANREQAGAQAADEVVELVWDM